jgi:hypothetical protein
MKKFLLSIILLFGIVEGGISSDSFPVCCVGTWKHIGVSFSPGGPVYSDNSTFQSIIITADSLFLLSDSNISVASDSFTWDGTISSTCNLSFTLIPNDMGYYTIQADTLGLSFGLGLSSNRTYIFIKESSNISSQETIRSIKPLYSHDNKPSYYNIRGQKTGGFVSNSAHMQIILEKSDKGSSKYLIKYH